MTGKTGQTSLEDVAKGQGSHKNSDTAMWGPNPQVSCKASMEQMHEELGPTRTELTGDATAPLQPKPEVNNKQSSRFAATKTTSTTLP